MKQIAIILWSAEYGGAETWSLALAKSLSRRGCGVGIVVVGGQGPLCERLIATGLPYRCMGLHRGRAVLAHFGRFASVVSEMGSDAAILPSGGYMSAALRWGGYPGSILAVEHGTLLQLPGFRGLRRLVRVVDAQSGAWAVDAHVVPSDYMLREIQRQSYGRSARRIYLGTEFDPAPRDQVARSAGDSGLLVLGFAGRLIRGKGLDVLLDAVSRAEPRARIRLEVAGDGPERTALEERAKGLGIGDRVRFRGWISDMRAFWPSCDLAVVPSEWMESFGMVAVEAMASGLPVIAARNGGLGEVVLDGETGALFHPGDVEGLTRLIEEYARNPERLEDQGHRALARARSEFNIDRCAEEFLDLVHKVARPGSRRPAVVGGA